MLFHAGIDVAEGVTLTETMLDVGEGGGVGFDGAPVDVCGPVVALGSVVVVLADCIILAAEPLPPPHPQPERARQRAEMTKRSNGELCGSR